MKQWIRLKDLKEQLKITKTIQALTDQAKREGWNRRRVAEKGKIYEYFVGDMPLEIQKALGFQGQKQEALSDNNIHSADIAIRLVEERVKLKLSQDDLARITGYTIDKIKNFERGKEELSVDFITKLLLLGVNLGYILTGDYAPNPNGMSIGQQFNGEIYGGHFINNQSH